MLPTANDAQPCVSHCGPTLRGCAPQKTFQPFMTQTKSCQRQAKTDQPIAVLLSLTWLPPTNDPLHFRNLGVFLCPDWVNQQVDDDADVCCIASQPS